MPISVGGGGLTSSESKRLQNVESRLENVERVCVDLKKGQVEIVNRLDTISKDIKHILDWIRKQ